MTLSCVLPHVCEGFENMAPVTIYTRDFCGYCARAKALLDSKGVDYAEYNATTTPEYRQEMIEKSGGTTFPQIFINGQHVGGCDDLHALERAGKLDVLLAA
ncbi:glutaredoxin 3 [Rhizobium sp. SEMIA 439]|nr:glutaredoxin 3 [Agrobacterium tumefaciens]QAA99540.1 glutaredoxin 3 [Agrobacterium tumefaciens]TGE79255.1 glutaredoxin 3 [Rhizobium sp. SEMIA 439]